MMTLSAAEHPVQQQLDAYNARDIDGFMQWWADDCQYYEFPSRLLAQGASALRARHLVRFREPNLFGALLKRICVDDVVVDHETVTRTFPEGPGEIDVIAIYQVSQGKIAKAWFKMGTPRLHQPGAVSILRAMTGDGAAILSLTRQAYAQWVPLIGREPLPMTIDYEQALHEHPIDMLFYGGRLAAIIEMVPDADDLLIKNLAVAPDLQGKGFGRKLLAHAETMAATLGLPAVRLYTNAMFTRNIALYQKAGFAIDREEAFMGGVTVHMSKRLGTVHAFT